jgi:hypothetical protein
MILLVAPAVMIGPCEVNAAACLLGVAPAWSSPVITGRSEAISSLVVAFLFDAFAVLILWAITLQARVLLGRIRRRTEANRHSHATGK